MLIQVQNYLILANNTNRQKFDFDFDFFQFSMYYFEIHKNMTIKSKQKICVQNTLKIHSMRAVPLKS